MLLSLIGGVPRIHWFKIQPSIAAIYQLVTTLENSDMSALGHYQLGR